MSIREITTDGFVVARERQREACDGEGYTELYLSIDIMALIASPLFDNLVSDIASLKREVEELRQLVWRLP